MPKTTATMEEWWPEPTAETLKFTMLREPQIEADQETVRRIPERLPGQRSGGRVAWDHETARREALRPEAFTWAFLILDPRERFLFFVATSTWQGQCPR